MKTFKTLLAEVFDRSSVHFTYKIDSFTKEHVYTFHIKDAIYNAYFFSEDAITGVYDLTFNLTSHKGESKHNISLTGLGVDTATLVFTTLIEIIKDFIRRMNPEGISFFATKTEGESRNIIYSHLLQTKLKLADYTYNVHNGFHEVEYFILKK